MIKSFGEILGALRQPRDDSSGQLTSAVRGRPEARPWDDISAYGARVPNNLHFSSVDGAFIGRGLVP